MIAFGRIVSVLLAYAAVLLPIRLLHAQEPVTFPAADGGVVSAELYGSGVRGVVLAPGGRFDKSSWEPQAHVLAEAGFRVLAMDLRGRGGSRPGTAGADGLQVDVLATVRYLREFGAQSIAAVGASFRCETSRRMPG